MLARISPGAAQVRLHRGMACLQRVEDAAELLERVLYQARFRSHLIPQASQLDENREQIGLFAGLFRPLLPAFIESRREIGRAAFPWLSRPISIPSQTPVYWTPPGRVELIPDS